MLLVLDNCEHVLSAAAALAESILVAGPEAVIVATSREPLGVDGETVRGVRSLAVPDPDADERRGRPPPRRSGLFVERASSATDTFALSDANVAAVVDDLRPARRDPVGDRAGRGTGAGDAPGRDRATARGAVPPALRRDAAPRNGTGRCRPAVSWSHDLLGETERLVFRRLAVFPPSFDLDAAEAVAGDPEIDVIDALVRLVDQSLVQYDATTGRYRLLETLRQYAADRLADAGETDLARDRHTDFYRSPRRRALVARRLPQPCDHATASTPRWTTCRPWPTGSPRTDQWGDLLGLGRNLFEFVVHLRSGRWRIAGIATRSTTTRTSTRRNVSTRSGSSTC